MRHLPVTIALTAPRRLGLVVLAAGLALAAPAPAQESRALLDALIRKGILTVQEADAIRAEVAAAPRPEAVNVVPGGRSTERLSLGMRVQIQYAHLSTDIDGAASQPAAVNHAALRRMYLTLRAGLGRNWGVTVTYDLASSGYDDAFLEWRPVANLNLNFGLRKVANAYEERFTSGDIRSLERSSVTRYFVERNNGRRLGAASYRIGAFLDGRQALPSDLSLHYSLAITNPERDESFTGASSFGTAATNHPALWAHATLGGKLPGRTAWLAGGGLAHLPDQGGFGVANLGRGADLTLANAFVHVTAPRWTVLAEYLSADVEAGTAAGRDATPRGFFLQPTLMLTDTIEAVVRYAWLDSDGRGVTLSDVVRSSASGGIMNVSTEWYAGANLYVRGQDLKFQLGAVHGKTRDTVNGAPAAATATGLRSQLQVQF